MAPSHGGASSEKSQPQECLVGSYIFCFCLGKHKFLPTPCSCQRHLRRNKNTFFLQQKINCAAPDSECWLWSSGPHKLCLGEAKQNHPENIQRAEESKFSKSRLSAVRKKITQKLVKFPESWCLQKTNRGFPLGVTHKEGLCLLYSWGPQLAVQDQPTALCSAQSTNLIH